jgi:hypothetical protein
MFGNVLAVVLGLPAGGLFNMALVSLNQFLYPFPANVDPNNLDSLREHVRANGWPIGALLIVLAAHAGGSFVSGLVLGLIAQRPWYPAAAVLGILWLCGGVAALSLIPGPLCSQSPTCCCTCRQPC